MDYYPRPGTSDSDMDVAGIYVGDIPPQKFQVWTIQNSSTGIQSDTGYIGTNYAADVLIRSGGLWVSDEINVGWSNSGGVDIRDGECVVNNLNIGVSFVGSVFLSATGGPSSSILNAGTVNVGYLGGLYVEQGGEVSISNHLSVGNSIDAGGELCVGGEGSYVYVGSGGMTLGIGTKVEMYDGGMITVSGNMSVQYSATFMFGLGSPTTPLISATGWIEVAGGFPDRVHLVVRNEKSSGEAFLLGEEYTIMESLAGVDLEMIGATVQADTGETFLITSPTGNEITLVVIPEPSTYALLGGVSAVALAAGARWRRRRKG